MGLHLSYKTPLTPFDLSIKRKIAFTLHHLHSIGIITHLQFSTSVPTLPYLNELENFNHNTKKKNTMQFEFNFICLQLNTKKFYSSISAASASFF
jgi:hypothetical protein